MTYTGVGLVEYAKSNIGNPYIYGTFGQIGNSKILSQKAKDYPSYVTPKRVEIVKANPDKYYGKPWHDCSGLIKGYLMRKNLTVVYQAQYDRHGAFCDLEETDRTSHHNGWNQRNRQ